MELSMTPPTSSKVTLLIVMRLAVKGTRSDVQASDQYYISALTIKFRMANFKIHKISTVPV